MTFPLLLRITQDFGNILKNQLFVLTCHVVRRGEGAEVSLGVYTHRGRCISPCHSKQPVLAALVQTERERERERERAPGQVAKLKKQSENAGRFFLRDEANASMSKSTRVDAEIISIVLQSDGK